MPGPLAPRRREGEFVFVAVTPERPAELPSQALIREDEATCNVLAGVHHDHLLVPVDRADEAIEVLG